MERRLDKIEERMTNLEDRVEKLEKPVVDKSTGLAKKLPAGHYVQIFAALNLQHAQQIRKNAISQLQGIIENPEEKVFITNRKQYFEVRIGVFDDYENTGEPLDIMQKLYKDAFVVTFPRPVILQDEYQDLQLIE